MRTALARCPLGGLVALMAIAATSTASSTAAARPAPPPPCPQAMPVGEIERATEGERPLAGSGLTVSRGTQPERFEAQVLGVLDDGVALDRDMIIAELDSAAIDRAGGVWAGISGSPVYAKDGRWIGAVAYTLAEGSTKIAGVTPAEDMAELLTPSGDEGSGGNRAELLTPSGDEGGGGNRAELLTPSGGEGGGGNRAAELPRALQRELVARGDVTAREAAAGLEPLPLPLSIAGVRPDRTRQLADRLAVDGRFVPVAAGRATPGPRAAAPVRPGSNFAAALSYGDVAAAAVGTTTVVCDGTVLAFGHPFLFTGPASLSAHAATAVGIQDDATAGPFKLANLGGLLGTIDADRQAGIRARLGAGPEPTRVSSTVASPARPTARAGVTQINRSEEVPPLAATHLVTNLDRVADRIGGGHATVAWTATGTAAGRPFTLTRENRFADADDISLAASEELLAQLDRLRDNRFAEVEFDAVTIDAKVGHPYRRYTIDGLEYRTEDGWAPVEDEPIPVTAGEALALRVRLSGYQGVVPDTALELSLDVPPGATGAGTLAVRGGLAGGDAVTDPPSFGALLAALRAAPRNDDVSATLSVGEGDETPPPAATATRRADEVVAGGLEAEVAVQPADAH